MRDSQPKNIPSIILSLTLGRPQKGGRKESSKDALLVREQRKKKTEASHMLCTLLALTKQYMRSVRTAQLYTFGSVVIRHVTAGRWCARTLAHESGCLFDNGRRSLPQTSHPLNFPLLPPAWNVSSVCLVLNITSSLLQR